MQECFSSLISQVHPSRSGALPKRWAKLSPARPASRTNMEKSNHVHRGRGGQLTGVPLASRGARLHSTVSPGWDLFPSPELTCTEEQGCQRRPIRDGPARLPGEHCG
jgi:hypothetical protein